MADYIRTHRSAKLCMVSGQSSSPVMHDACEDLGQHYLKADIIRSLALVAIRIYPPSISLFGASRDAALVIYIRLYCAQICMGWDSDYWSSRGRYEALRRLDGDFPPETLAIIQARPQAAAQ